MITIMMTISRTFTKDDSICVLCKEVHGDKNELALHVAFFHSIVSEFDNWAAQISTKQAKIPEGIPPKQTANADRADGKISKTAVASQDAFAVNEEAQKESEKAKPSPVIKAVANPVKRAEGSPVKQGEAIPINQGFASPVKQAPSKQAGASLAKRAEASPVKANKDLSSDQPVIPDIPDEIQTEEVGEQVKDIAGNGMAAKKSSLTLSEGIEKNRPNRETSSCKLVNNCKSKTKETVKEKWIAVDKAKDCSSEPVNPKPRKNSKGIYTKDAQKESEKVMGTETTKDASKGENSKDDTKNSPAPKNIKQSLTLLTRVDTSKKIISEDKRTVAKTGVEKQNAEKKTIRSCDEEKQTGKATQIQKSPVTRRNPALSSSSLSSTTHAKEMHTTKETQVEKPATTRRNPDKPTSTFSSTTHAKEKHTTKETHVQKSAITRRNQDKPTSTSSIATNDKVMTTKESQVEKPATTRRNTDKPTSTFSSTTHAKEKHTTKETHVQKSATTRRNSSTSATPDVTKPRPPTSAKPGIGGTPPPPPQPALASPPPVVTRRLSCGVCVKCKLANCGVCVVCQDMPAFGGKGRLVNKVCVKKVCRIKS